LTEESGLDGPVEAEELQRALDAISGELARLDELPRPDVLVGMGGAITNMTAVMLRMAVYDPEKVQGSVLSREEVDRQIELYRSRDIEARREIVGLQPLRAGVILAGACVVRTVMDKLGRETLRVSDRGLRHGLLTDRFGLKT
jgi:exopolyphosphatase/guanosine-5'-triphosphate,3'-diphosphate pyrophosphatase